MGVIAAVISEKTVLKQKLFPECLGSEYSKQYFLSYNNFHLEWIWWHI